jgi:hypothetical protein
MEKLNNLKMKQLKNGSLNVSMEKKNVKETCWLLVQWIKTKIISFYHVFMI